MQAEDLLSETFVRVIKRLPTFRGECEVKTWLFGIARNIWLESLRRRHQSVSLDDLMERYITDDALTETTAARQKLRRVQALLQQRTSAPAAWYTCGRRGIRTRKLPKNCK